MKKNRNKTAIVFVEYDEEGAEYKFRLHISADDSCVCSDDGTLLAMLAKGEPIDGKALIQMVRGNHG